MVARQGLVVFGTVVSLGLALAACGELEGDGATRPRGDGGDAARGDGARADGTAGDARGAPPIAIDGGTADAPAVDAARGADAAEAGDGGVEVCGNGLDDDRDRMIDEGCVCAPAATQPCYPGAARLAGVGRCRLGQQTCSNTGEFGAWGACMNAVLPVAEVCDNRVDDDCDGMTDEGCRCIGTSGAPWEEWLDTRVHCYGANLDRNAREFQGSWVQVPSEPDSRWRRRAALTIDFNNPSTIPDTFCDGRHTGGVFTYFQTSLDLSGPDPLPTRVIVSSGGVDDGTQLRVYNSMHPGGFTHSTWTWFSAGTANITPYLVRGPNRIVLIHVDDNPSTRALTNVRVEVDGRMLRTCP